MEYHYTSVQSTVHRLIPSRFPPISLFDWAETPEELEGVAALEGLTNDRLITEYGDIHLIAKNDWVSGPGATPLMAAFTHPGNTRFSDGSYGVYYSGDSLETAIAETKFHRERFLNASNEAACLVQMREYTSKILRQLADIAQSEYSQYLNPNPDFYSVSQAFGREFRAKQEWGLLYPSVRKIDAKCVAIFRPPALTIPVQGCHLDYIWDGNTISEIRRSLLL
jgi:hypothetical protein